MSDNPFAGNASGGSSNPFAGRSSGGGSGNPFAGGGGGGASQKGGGGILGDLQAAAHWVASKADLAAQGLKEIPGGIYDTVNTGVVQPWKDVVTTGHVQPKTNANIDKLTQQTADQTVQTIQHPLRDPFQTLLLAAPALHGVGRVAENGAAAVGAARAGEGVGGVAKALVSAPPVKQRLISVGDTQLPLQASTSPAVRVAQQLHDAIVQNRLNSNPEGIVAGYANRRVGGSLAETGRYQQRMREVPANMLASAGKQASKADNVPPTIGQAALRLTSEQSLADEAAAYHRGQAAQGVSPDQNLKQAAIYDAVHKLGILQHDATRPAGEQVSIDAAKFPSLAATDVQLAKGQAQVDQIAAEHGIRTPEALQARIDAPGRVRAGAKYVEGAPPEAAKEGAKLEAQGQLSLAPRSPSEAVGKGFVGGENARPGRGFVTYKTVEPKASKSPAAASGGPVTGEQRPFIQSHEFTASGMEHGQVPDNTTRLAAQHMRDAYRYVNTDQFRKSALQTGADTRRSSRDVLVRIPGEQAGKIPAEIDQALGRKNITTDELQGHQDAFEAWRHSLVPGVADKFATDKAQQIGAKAPEGYRWVDRGVLGGLGRAMPGPRGKVARSVDNVNSAVTAATVYFKIGHVGTRVLTNAATNIIQGSAKPQDIARSLKLWHSLAPAERNRALAAAGQHGFAAMPTESGTGAISRGIGATAKGGANFWAKHADIPFRFNSIAYEARKAGFDTPAKFRQMLDQLENPAAHGLSAAQAAKVDWVAKRANRAQIAYDRLNESEKRYITRGVWFYPWVKGATMFAGHTLSEHPLKAGALGVAGAHGREKQLADLGKVPSYAGGAFKVGGPDKAGHPLIADFSTFSPFATPADVLEVAAGKSHPADFFNPALAGAGSLAYGIGNHGRPSAQPIKDSLNKTISPAWPIQVAAAFHGRNADQSKRMYPKSPQWYGTKDSILRALIGPGMPRRMNIAAAASAEARQRAGR